MKKKALALVLTLAFVLAVFPVGVHAVDYNLPSLWEEYDDYFIMGTFGDWGNAQQKYHYRTNSPANALKLDSQIGNSNTNSLSRQAYLARVAEIEADGSLTEEQKAAALEEANNNVVLVETPPVISTLNAIRQWNAENPDEQPKVVRAHVLVWHGGQQPNYFFCNGFVYDAANPDWASPETMLARLETYIDQMMAKYAPYNDIIYSWDVVNEAIDDYTGQIRNQDDYQVGQWGHIFRRRDLDNDPDARLLAESIYVYKAFEFSRKYSDQYGADWKLYYNDFQDSNKLYEPKMSQTIKMLEPIYEAGFIDGYGMQGRLAYAYPSIELLREQIELGLTVADEISFSEADLRSDFIPNPYYDPDQPTRRVQEGDPEWPLNSGSWTYRSAGNGNTFDVHNSPVMRNPIWGDGNANVFSTPAQATLPEIQRAQADFAADLMDLLIEYSDEFVAFQWDGTNDSGTFNRTTGCHMWDTSGNEKMSFFSIIGAPNRDKMKQAIAAGPADEAQADYTAASWTAYAEAKAAAEALVDVRIYDIGGVNAVKDATAKLLAAIEALEEGGGEEPIDAESIKITGARTVRKNRSTQLTLAVEPEGAVAKGVTWEVLEEGMAEIDENGLLTGLAIGHCFVQATTEDGLIAQFIMEITP